MEQPTGFQSDAPGDNVYQQLECIRTRMYQVLHNSNGARLQEPGPPPAQPQETGPSTATLFNLPRVLL